MPNRDAEEAEQRYRQLVELCPDGISISHEGRIVFANTALARMLGATNVQQLIGRGYRQTIHSDSIALVEQRIERVLAGETAGWAKEKWLRLDGSVVEVETAAVPITQNGMLLVQLFTRDLTPRNEVEKALEEHRRRLQGLFEMSIDAILLIDDDGRYIDANPAAEKLSGYTHAELMQMKLGDLTTPEERGRITELWSHVFKHGTGQGVYILVSKDGTHHVVQVQTLGHVSSGVHYSLLHDITELKRAEESLRNLSLGLLRSQDEERRRISRQLHETTAQNLAALRMNLTRIKDSGSRELIDDSIELTEQSIREIRTLSYLLHPPLMDELGLVSTLQWYATGFEQRSGIAVAVDANEDIGRLPREIETAVFRIVQEALTNIHRHAESAVASIRLRREHDELSLEIADRGRGFRDDVTPGVGLTGINERVRDLHGEMDIKSGAEGTTIRVRLPL